MEKIRNQITLWIRQYKEEPLKNSVVLGSVLFLCILPESFSSLTAILLACLIYYASYRSKDFGFKSSPSKNLGYAFLIALCLFVFAQIELVLHSRTLFIMPKVYSLGNLILYAILLALLEEVAYRGVFLSLRPIIRRDALLVGLIALVYMLHMRSISGLLLGLVLGVLVLKSGSLYPAIFTSFMTRILLIYEFHHIEQFSWLLRLLSTRSTVESAGMYLLDFGFFALAMSWACKCIDHDKTDQEIQLTKISRIQIPKTPLWRNKEKTHARQAYVLTRIHKRVRSHK